VFLIANFLEALAGILDIVLNLYMWVIIVRALISWVNPDPYNPIVQMLYRITDPVLNRIRRLIPAYSVGIDISPIIVILAIMFLRGFLVQSLFELARRMH
jgi:YggT family protein